MSNKANPVIDLADIHVIYDGTCVLDLQAFTVDPGERLFLLGRSGSGKTTLMRVIKGRIRPATGTVSVMDGDPCTRDRSARTTVQRSIAMVDQEFHLVPRMRVIDNVLTGCLGRTPRWRSLFGWYPDAEWEKAESILNEVGLEGLGDRRVETLSGGQRQRAAIARALMQEADIILADEPISNLDPELAEDALELLVECVERRGVTLVVSIHQPSFAKRFATRLVGLLDGEIIYDGAPRGLTDEISDKVYRSSLEPPTQPEAATDNDHTTKEMAKKTDPPDLRLLGP